MPRFHVKTAQTRTHMKTAELQAQYTHAHSRQGLRAHS